MIAFLAGAYAVQRDIVPAGVRAHFLPFIIMEFKNLRKNADFANAENPTSPIQPNAKIL